MLDRSGLLWQFYVIDGLADGRVALYGKVHHGIIDGRTFVKAVTQWMSEDPKDKEVRAMWDGVARPPAAPRQRAGLVQRLIAAGSQAAGLVRSAAGVYGMLAEQGLRSAGLGKGLPLPFLNVPGAFEGKLSAQAQLCLLHPAAGRDEGARQGPWRDRQRHAADRARHGHAALPGQAAAHRARSRWWPTCRWRWPRARRAATRSRCCSFRWARPRPRWPSGWRRSAPRPAA